MYPILLKTGPFAIHSWGVMLAVSVLFGIWFSSRRAERRMLVPEHVSNMAIYAVLGGIVGARLYYVVLHFEEFRDNLSSIINPFEGEVFGLGGLVLYGGLIGAIGASFFYFRRKRICFLEYADVIAPSAGLGIFLTRIGCFLNGCCYGRPTESPIGVHFPSCSAAGAFQHSIASSLNVAVSDVKLLPSQLYMSLGGLIIALVLLAAGKKRRFQGFEFYLLVVLYTVDRFIIDFTRVYTPDEKLGIFSHNQILCVVLFVVFGAVLLKNACAKGGSYA